MFLEIKYSCQTGQFSLMVTENTSKQELFCPNIMYGNKLQCCLYTACMVFLINETTSQNSRKILLYWNFGNKNTYNYFMSFKCIHYW